ncbi:response regulator transcription factor [Dehalogenimonas sp. 4OHTPN]|uniref:Response regulator transcription factor n=1 Tax=Dehalogenimonas sp. 4OHTPN TaxID=3166643 RepID=A0AAU8G6L6_9CHLR
MFNILILAEENDKTRELKNRLSREGYVCLLMPPGEEPEKLAAQHTARLVVVDVGAEDDIPTLDTAGESKGPMLVAAVFRQRLAELGARDDVDDFVLKPFDVDELLTRIRKLAARAKATPPSDIIVAGDLIIDTARCEVSLAGAPIDLTFREYELLKFLATNRGRVFSREVLLNKVWGYEYFGGDRTVDVHVRRLRSKIEEFGQIYVETVRNIGYRFKRNL